MASEPGRNARELCGAAHEALIDAGFRTGDLSTAEKLFGDARALAARDGDREAEALAVAGLGLAHHYRNIASLVDGLTPSDAEIAAEEDLMRHALVIWQEIGDAAGTAQGFFGMGLVHQVLHRDWATAMLFYWQAFGLAEAMEESGDLYGRSEVHRHLGFYYLVEDIRPREAVRQLGHALALRERLGDPRLIPSALVALAEAELLAGNPRRAVELVSRAVPAARDARLLPWRIEDAEQTLRDATEALSATG